MSCNKLLYVRMWLLLLKVVNHSSLHYFYILFTLKIGTHRYRLSLYQSNDIQFASLVASSGIIRRRLNSAGLKFDAHARIHSICLRTRICLAISTGSAAVKSADFCAIIWQMAILAHR